MFTTCAPKKGPLASGINCTLTTAGLKVVVKS